MAETRTLIEIPAFVTVRELATLMTVSPINVIKELMANGIMANINQQIDFETAAIVAGEMGYDVVAHEEAAAAHVPTGWGNTATTVSGRREASRGPAYARR